VDERYATRRHWRKCERGCRTLGDCRLRRCDSMTAARNFRCPMDYAFILDPLPDLKAYKDSSVAMMRSLAARGHRIYALEQSDIFWDARGTQASAVPLTLLPGDHDW